jgi:hypothetical protein
MRLPIFLAALIVAAGSPALAKECRIPDARPGIRVQLPPECRNLVQSGRAEAERREALRSDRGFINLGNGTQVRIGGRVRVEAGGRR